MIRRGLVSTGLSAWAIAVAIGLGMGEAARAGASTGLVADAMPLELAFRHKELAGGRNIEVSSDGRYIAYVIYEPPSAGFDGRNAGRMSMRAG